MHNGEGKLFAARVRAPRGAKAGRALPSLPARRLAPRAAPACLQRRPVRARPAAAARATPAKPGRLWVGATVIGLG
jgi:hypothetical protein